MKIYLLSILIIIYAVSIPKAEAAKLTPLIFGDVINTCLSRGMKTTDIGDWSKDFLYAMRAFFSVLYCIVIDGLIGSIQNKRPFETNYKECYAGFILEQYTSW
jgi:hypothetical protein